MKLPRIFDLRIRTRIILACAVFGLLAILAPALLLPRFIDLEALKAQMSTQVNARLEGKLQTDRLEWAWLPLPHLNLRNTRFASEETTLVAPTAKVYPDWWSLFRGQVRIGKVVLVNPDISVKQLPTALSEPPDPELSGLKVVIRNGTLHVAANSQWTALQSRDFTLKSLNGSLAISLDDIAFDLGGNPAEGEHLAASGKYLREDESYRFNFSCRNFNLKKVLLSFAHGSLAPADSPLNLKGSFEGRGFEKINGKITGDSSCLLAFPKDKKILVDCGVVDLAFAKDGDDLQLTLNEFEMRDPGLKLSGSVRRSGGGEGKPAPVWQIDLKGEDLNLTRIRGAVLSLWGDTFIAKELGRIVQSGKAGKASYSFKGTDDEFQYARNMHITAEDIDASIMIPEVDLLLDNVTGKMRVEKGLLIVDGDQARMGNSRGKNGHLVLGLPDDDFTFKLDVDLDADLAELPGVLARLVDHQPFQDELARFSGVSGRATGHLHLGDHLRKFKVAVEVATMQGKGHYAPLAQDFVVDGGGMTIAPPMVQWRNVRGTYGPHVVKNSAGQVRWPDDDIFLDVTQLDAVLAAKELEKEDLSYFKEISGGLHEYITRASGRIELRNTTISGKASEPKLWKADADLVVKNLAVETPSFPEPVLFKEGKAHLSNTAVTVSDASGIIMGDSFTLGASLTHQSFTALRGKISLQGRVGQGFGQWLKDKHLVAPSLFPHLPCLVESLQIDLLEEKIQARGVIRPEVILFSPPRADISLEFSKDAPEKMSAHVYGGKEDAAITLTFLDKAKETFLFSWKGELSKKTVDQLLERKNLLNGKIAGDFQIYLPLDPNKVAFTGQLEAKDLRWFLDEEAERFVDIQELRLAGVGKDLKVKRLACAFNETESAVVNGLISRVASGLTMKLDLVSPALSRKTLLDLKESLKRFKDHSAKTSSPGEPQQESPWNITGTVAFDVDKFISGPKTGDSASPTLVWQPLKGEIKIHPQWRMSALINNGRLCCLDTTGEWFSTPELGQSHFFLKSACPTPPRFETVLPCLGYPQDLIEGEFSLDGRLDGVLDNWKDGHLQIESHQGRILRMKLLSKIFSVVNITDLFSVGTGNGPEASTKGFPYTDLLFKTHVKDNELIIDEAVVRGEGLNLFARGKMNLSTFELDVVVLISPFKTLDAIVSKVPLVGRIIGGDTATLVTFPVGVTGKANDPQVTLLPSSAVGEGLMNIVKRTLLLPFHIFSPVLPDGATEPEKK